jgi:hypothetical protein
MIQEFIDKYMSNKNELRKLYSEKHPEDYAEVVKNVINLLSGGYGSPDPERIHVIDDGDYQGTLLFIIPNHGYQPRTYWAVFVDYGSCSGCDTLESIREHSSKKPTEQQIDGYMTLSLHIVQSIKQINS